MVVRCCGTLERTSASICHLQKSLESQISQEYRSCISRHQTNASGLTTALQNLFPIRSLCSWPPESGTRPRPRGSHMVSSCQGWWAHLETCGPHLGSPRGRIHEESTRWCRSETWHLKYGRKRVEVRGFLKKSTIIPIIHGRICDDWVPLCCRFADLLICSMMNYNLPPSITARITHLLQAQSTILAAEWPQRKLRQQDAAEARHVVANPSIEPWLASVRDGQNRACSGEISIQHAEHHIATIYYFEI